MHSRARVIFFQDMLFFTSSAAVTFLFALAINGGELRMYIFLGSAIGFTAYYLTIGRVVMRFAGAVAAVILRIWHTFWTIVLFPFRFLFGFIRRPIEGFIKTVEKLPEISLNILKKGLKHTLNLLYNQKKRKQPTSSTYIERESRHDESR
jgi:spore cortex biosynthesis protein YabQ